MELGKTIFMYVVIMILVFIISVLVVFNITKENKHGFTELYFTDELPKTIKINENVNFSFGIHNLENKRMDYSYEVYARTNKIDEGSLSLNHDETKIITKSFIVEKVKESSMPISVKLLNKDQEIHFWVDVK